MRKILFLIVFLISIISLYAATVTVQVGNVKFHINDNPLATFVWNQQANDDCRCWSGVPGDCWFETVKSEVTTLTHETGTNTITISGHLLEIPVTVQTGTGGTLELQAKSDNFEVPISWFTIDDNWFGDIPIGTIIDIPTFTTNLNGEFSVIGTIRP